jgi:transposase
VDTQTTTLPEIEYETYQIGVAYVVKDLLKRLGIVEAIDSVMEHQPEIGASYGTLAQVVIINRLSFNPQPLYSLSAWAQQHGIDRLLEIDAAWLDDDRLGALMEALAKHAAQIWMKVIVKAVAQFAVVLEWLHADTTSIYFEGVYEDEQDQALKEAYAPRLLQGYNKDGKPNNLQFVLSLIVNQRIPVWYKIWDGNQSDDDVYLVDLKGLRQTGLDLSNTILIFDRKGCNIATMLELCKTGQAFLGAHPWTDSAKAKWEQIWQELQSGKRSWTEVDYVARNDQRKGVESRPRYRVCEVGHELEDKITGKSYPLRWVFSWNSNKAELDARQRQKALESGEQALQKIAHLLGKYSYTKRTIILDRLGKLLKKAHANLYFQYNLTGSDEKQDWQLIWKYDLEAVAHSVGFDGVVLLCTNISSEQLSPGEVMKKYKEQVSVEQTFDFIKSPVQIRPLWLHAPQRLAGLTLLIMLAVLIATLIEHRVREHIAKNKKLLKGLMPENRDNPYPTAEKLLKAFQDYTIVVTRFANGHHEVHYPKPRPIQRQILNILSNSPPNPI